MSKQTAVKVDSPPDPLQIEADRSDAIPEMISVSKEEFIPGLALPADLFVVIGSGKYVSIAKEGSKSSISELHVTQSNQVENFFVRKNDYRKIVEHNVRVSAIFMKRIDIPIERKVTFINTAARSVLLELLHGGMDSSMMHQINQLLGSLCGQIQTGKDYLRFAGHLMELPDFVASEGLVGAALAVLVGKELGWSDPAMLEKLASGALLRDIGYLKLNNEIINKSEAELTHEERKLRCSHPKLGVELLSQFPSTPAEILSIVRDHHACDPAHDSGERRIEARLSPLSKVVSVVEVFVQLTRLKKYGGLGKTSEEAIQFIEYKSGPAVNVACLIALKRVLGLQKANDSHFAAGVGYLVPIRRS